MKRFRFPLEKLLRLRHQETEAAKGLLARALAEQRQRQQQLDEARAALREQIEQAVSRRRLTAQEFAAERRYVGVLQAMAEAAAAALGEAEAQAEGARQRLVECRQREQMLAKLKERRLEEYRTEAARAEQAVLDEWGGRKPDTWRSEY